MKFPIESQQFAARLTNEDLTFVNELIPELLPDRDLSDSTITGRELIMAMAETASLKLRKIGQSRPDDLTKIKERELMIQKITEDFNTLQSRNIADGNELEARQTLIDELTLMVSEGRNELETVKTNHSQVSEKARTLEKYAPVPNEMRILIEPLTAKVLALYAEKIRLKNKTEVTPGEILISLFNRYITKRETELPGFPFLVSKPEMIELAKEISNE